MQKRTYQIGPSTLILEFGDLTTSSADVLVSSDDSYLTMGGGVSAAILRAAGESLLRDAAKKVPARLGDVVVTTAGALEAKYVFHAITIGKGELTPEEVLTLATSRCLELLRTLRLKSIAFPALGAGAAGFAYQDVARRMVNVIVESLKDDQEPLDVTIFLYDRFRRMQPIDYVDFFETIAAHLSHLAPATLKAKRRLRAAPSATTRGPRIAKQERRKKQITLLGELDREREQLEEKLAEYEGTLSKQELGAIQGRLQELHRERVQLLTTLKSREPSHAVSVFVSYSHVDEKLRKKLGTHLNVLARQGLISTWHDRMIGAGSEWAGAIDAHLEDSHVVLLLISSDFIASSYCYDVEMKRALERHESRDALVIPVILRPVLLKGSPFAMLQALPRDARALNQWPSFDAACVDVVEGVRDAVLALGTASHKQGTGATARQNG